MVCYVKGSVIITINKNFEELRDIFADSVLASAIIDRIVHHFTVIKARSAGGISPPAAHRTVHKPLDLHGSYQPFSRGLTATGLRRKSNAPPDFPVGKISYELIYPLHSTLITRASTLLRDNPPPSYSSVLSPFVGCTYKVFP